MSPRPTAGVKWLCSSSLLRSRIIVTTLKLTQRVTNQRDHENDDVSCDQNPLVMFWLQIFPNVILVYVRVEQNFRSIIGRRRRWWRGGLLKVWMNCSCRHLLTDADWATWSCFALHRARLAGGEIMRARALKSWREHDALSALSTANLSPPFCTVRSFGRSLEWVECNSRWPSQYVPNRHRHCIARIWRRWK